MPESTVLVIDDDRTIHPAVESRLRGLVSRVLGAEGPAEGIRLAMQQRPDVILLDINMPDMDGYKVCQHLKDHPSTRDIPILFLTVDREVSHLARALDCGGSDYILKPFNAIELEARVRVALRTKRMFDLLREQAHIDALTGLHNRAALEDALASSAAALDRAGHPFALVMIDLDRFKSINDTFGHGIGDAVLREIGGSIRACCRPYDVACRLGGDEFTVVLGHTEGEAAIQVATRIGDGIRKVAVRSGSTDVQVTSSAGVASTAEMSSDFDAQELLKAADNALYRAKREGRDRIVRADAA